MIPEAVKKLIKKHGKEVAHDGCDNYEKTKLARQYNPETKAQDEMIEEMARGCSSWHSKKMEDKK